MVVVERSEIIHLYRLMKRQEGGLDENLQRLLMRVERRLYESLSIQDIEMLGEANVQMVDSLSSKL